MVLLDLEHLVGRTDIEQIDIIRMMLKEFSRRIKWQKQWIEKGKGFLNPGFNSTIDYFCLIIIIETDEMWKAIYAQSNCVNTL